MDELYEYNGKQYTLADLQEKYGDKVGDAISKFGFKKVAQEPTYSYKDKTYTRSQLEEKYGDKTDEAISKFGFASSEVKKKEEEDSQQLLQEQESELATEETQDNGSLDIPQEDNRLKYVERAEQRDKENPVADTAASLKTQAPKTEASTVKTPEVKADEKESYGKNLWRQIQTGSGDLGQMMASIPESIYNIMAWPQNVFSEISGVDITTDSDKFKKDYGIKNTVLEYYTNEVERLEAQTEKFNENRYDETGIIDNIRKGNIGDAFELLGSGISRSAPVSLAMMAGGATVGSASKLTAVSTPMFLEQNRQDLKSDNPEMSEAELTLKSLGMAGAETLFGSISTGTLGKVYREVLLKEGAETGAIVFKEGLIKAYETALKKYGMAASFTGEGIEEVATQITQNMISGKDAFEGVGDAFILGAGGGALYGSPLTAVKAKDVVKQGVAQVKVNNILKPTEYDNISSVFNFEGNEIDQTKLDLSMKPINRKVLEKDLAKAVQDETMTAEEAKTALGNFDKLSSINGTIADIEFTPEQKTKVSSLLFERETLEKLTKDKDPHLFAAEKDRINEINNEIANVRNTEEDVIPTEEEIDYYDLAGRELAKEYEDAGITEYTITNDEISKRAEEIYKRGKGKVEAPVDNSLKVNEFPIKETETPVTELTPTGLTPTEIDNLGGNNTISESVGNDLLYTKDGKTGRITQSGEIISFETETEIIDLGSVDELKDQKLSDLGLLQEKPIEIAINDDNSVTIEGESYINAYSNPSSAISINKKGEYSVSLETKNGEKRTFRGRKAEQIVYEIKLKEYYDTATREQQAEAERLADEAISKREAEQPSNQGENTNTRSGEEDKIAAEKARREAAMKQAEQENNARKNGGVETTTPIAPAPPKAPTSPVKSSDKEAKPAKESSEFNRLIDTAREGDEESQKKLSEFDFKWEKEPVVRFVSKSEVDALQRNEKIEGKNKESGVDVTKDLEGEKVPATNNDYRVKFKEDGFDDKKEGSRVKMKNEQDGWITDGYSLEDVDTIEKRNSDGTWETVYDANKPKNDPKDAKKNTSETTPTKIDPSPKKEQSEKEVEGIKEAIEAEKQADEFEELLGGEAAKRREKGSYEKDGIEFVRQESIDGFSGDTAKIKFADNETVEVQYKVIEADKLQPSHLGGNRNPNFFITEAQPKNRTDDASQKQSDKIGQEPNFDELGANNLAYSGAPVVNSRGEVIQGNNRSEGLKKHYKNKGTKYKEDLKKNAAKYGIDPSAVDKLKNPVLVRVANVTDARAIALGNLDVKDIETGGKRRIDAVATTRRIPKAEKARLVQILFSENTDQTLNAAIRSKPDAVIGILKNYLNDAQVNSLFNSDGNLKPEGIKDIEDVVNHFLFEDGDANLPSMFENLSSKARNALIKSLPKILSIAPSKSLLKEIQGAIAVYNEFANSDVSEFDIWKNQVDMFKDGKSPKELYNEIELEIADVLLNTQKEIDIRKVFSEYAELVNGKEGDMFEAATEGLSKNKAIEKTFNVKSDEKTNDTKTGSKTTTASTSKKEGPAESKNSEAKQKVEKKPAKPDTKQESKLVRDKALQDELAKEFEVFKASFGKLNSGVNPETLISGVKIVGIYVKSGVYKFADIVKDVHENLGEVGSELLKGLRAAYSAYRENADQDIYDKMDASTRSFDLGDLTIKGEESNSKTNENPKKQTNEATEKKQGEKSPSEKSGPQQGDKSRSSDNGGNVQADGGKPAQKNPERPKIVVQANPPTTKDHITGDYNIDESQRIGVNSALDRFEKGGGGFLLADGTGVGKTRQILVTAAEFAKKSGKKVLIITESRPIIDNNFASDAKALGINMKDFEVGTYNDVRTGKVGKSEYGLVIFDEAHNLKNQDSQKTIASNNIETDHKMFVTATPMDTTSSAVYFISEINNVSEQEAYNMLGLEVKTETNPNTKEKYKVVSLKEGVSPDQVIKNIVNIREKTINEGGMLRREYPFFGEFEENTIALTDAEMNEQYAIEEYWDEVIADAVGFKKMNLSGQKSGELSRWNETKKIKYVVSEAIKEIKAGRKVVIIAEGVNETTLKSTGETHEGFINTVVTDLEGKGYKVAKIFGKNDKTVANNEFQDGDVDVVIGTSKSASTGIDLDDQVGNSPRTLFMVTPNYSGNVFQQILGRVSRRNTKSPAKVRLVYKESISDTRRKEIVGVKLKTLRAIQEGKIGDEVSIEKTVAERVSSVNVDDISTKDISEKAFIIQGDTYKIKEQLSSLGGKWNRNAKGWMFPTTRKAEIQSFIESLRKDNNSANENNLSYTFTKQEGTPETYTTQDEQKINFASVAKEGQLELFNAKGDPIIDRAKPNNIQRKGSAGKTNFGYRKLKPGETALVERQFKDWNHIKLYGRSTKIGSPNDVAYLFRQLESEAIEHIFAVHHFADGTYKVQHLGTGIATATIADTKAILAGVKEFGSTSVTIVHNHPSGNLTSSQADRNIMEAIGKSLPDGVELNDGVILNLTSGKYLTFNSKKDLLLDEASGNKEGVEVTPQTFSRKVFTEDLFKAERIRSSAAVAEVVSKIKFGTGQKTAALFLDNSNRVVATLFTDPSRKNWKRDFEADAVKFGAESVIFARNKDNHARGGDFTDKISTLNSGVIKILDVITTEASNFIKGQDYYSYADYDRIGNGNWVRESNNVSGDKSSTTQLDNLIGNIDKAINDLDKFGKESLGLNFPVVVAKQVLQAMKLATIAAKSVVEVTEAGIKALKKTDWYKGLSAKEQIKAVDNFDKILENSIKPGKERDLSLSSIGSTKAKGELKAKAIRLWNNTFKSGSGLDVKFSEIIRNLERNESVILDGLQFEAKRFKSILKSVGKGLSTREKNERFKTINDYMSGENVDVSFLSDEQLTQIDYFRSRVDDLSEKLIGLLENKLNDLIEQQDLFPDNGLIRAAIENTQKLIETIENNKEKYLTRSYQAFRDPKYIERLTVSRSRMSDENKIKIDNVVEYLVEYEGYSLEDAKDFVADYLDEIKKSDAQNFITSTTGRANAPFFKKRKNLPAVFRELLGESKDPLDNYLHTVYGISNYIGNITYQEKMREQIMASGLGSYVAKSGYTKMVPDSDGWGILSGIVVPNEFAQAVKDVMPIDPVKDGFMKAWIGMTAVTKVGKTVWSPTTIMRNLWSGILLGANAGHSFLLHPYRAEKAFKQALDFQTTFTNAEAKDLRQRLIAYGVMKDGVSSGEVRATLNDFTNRIDRISKGNAITKAIETMNKIYAFGDDFYKVVGFLTEKDRLIMSGMNETQAELKAAERITGGYPTYSYLPRNVKKLRRFPLIGTFVSFPYETVRSTKNNALYVAEDLKEGRTSMAMKRLAGMIVSTAIPTALALSTRAMIGWDDDDEEALRTMLPSYQENSLLIYSGSDKGVPTFWDATTLFPSEVWVKPIATLVGQRSHYETAIKQIAKGADEALQPYYGLDVFTKTIQELSANKNQYGQEIYKGENLAEGILKSPSKVTNHLLKGAGPGAYNNLGEFARANNIAPSFFGEKVTDYGRTYTNEDALFALAGFRMTTVNYYSAMTYKGYDFKDRAREASYDIMKMAKSKRNISNEDAQDAFKKYKKDYKVIEKDLQKVVNVARKLNMDEDKIWDAINTSYLGKADLGYFLDTGRLTLKPISRTAEKNYNKKIDNTYDEAAEKILEPFHPNIDKINDLIFNYNKSLGD